MQLVGFSQRDPAPGDYRMIGNAFKRLPAEVMKPGQLNRMIGLHAVDAAGKQSLWFMGVKVIDATEIPEGMVAWDISDDALRISEMRDGQRTVVDQFSIAWRWRETLATDPGQWMGEFVVRSDEAHTYQPFAVVPYDPQRGGLQDDVTLADYSPDWPKKFSDMETWLKEKLGDIAIRIEHYGSTSIPGIAAKPVVDVLLEIPSFEEAAPKLLTVMSGPQWEFWQYSDHYVFFRRAGLMGPRQYHIHCAPKDHVCWQGLAFRDYLRTHADAAAQYLALKRKLAGEFKKDREAYTQAKTEFVLDITRRAMQNKI